MGTRASSQKGSPTLATRPSPCARAILTIDRSILAVWHGFAGGVAARGSPKGRPEHAPVQARAVPNPKIQLEEGRGDAQADCWLPAFRPRAARRPVADRSSRVPVVCEGQPRQRALPREKGSHRKRTTGYTQGKKKDSSQPPRPSPAEAQPPSSSCCCCSNSKDTTATRERSVCCSCESI